MRQCLSISLGQFILAEAIIREENRDVYRHSVRAGVRLSTKSYRIEWIQPFMTKLRPVMTILWIDSTKYAKITSEVSPERAYVFSRERKA